MKKNISLIIPALTSSFYLEDFLINICSWSILPKEIIIINTSNRAYNLSSYIKKKLRERKINLKFILKKGLFPGAARNIGIYNSKFKYIAFLDMNTLPYSKDWLKNNFKYLIRKKLDGVYGQTFYLADSHKEFIVRASTYGKALLRTIPGSIFKRKVVLEVGKFSAVSRAGEDTDWLRRLDTKNLKIKKSLEPVYYKGLYNVNYSFIIKKWFRNYFFSSKLPHLNNQKNFYYLCIFLISFLFVFNWNYSSLCLNNTLCLNQKNEVFIPHITKIFLLISFVFYMIIRGIIIPIKKKINIKYLFPYKFISITIFSFILDAVKSITFLALVLLKILNLKPKK